MLGCLSHYKKLPVEEVEDEMLSILSDRNRIIQKKELESTNARWNEYLNQRKEWYEEIFDRKIRLDIDCKR
jgi:hypothetical protein